MEMNHESTTDPVKPSCKLLAPMVDVPTRWGSRKAMLDRSLLIRPGLDAIASQIKELRKFELDEEE